MEEIMNQYKEKYGPITYNPTHGYEPYWEDGDWVFKDKELPPNTTTTTMPQVCGEECNYLYKEIKDVCGRLTSSRQYKGCYSKVGWVCYGNEIDDLTRGFHTFPTYCKFLDAQCRSSFTDKWIFVHMGKCIDPQTLSFKPISIADQIVSRRTYYYTQLSQVFVNHSLPGFHFS